MWNLWISVAYIPDVSDKEANKESRMFEDLTDWQLNPDQFKKNCERSVKPDIDLFIRVPVNNYISMFHIVSQEEQ